MKRLSGRFGIRKLIAVTGAGVLLSSGLGVAAASAADGTSGAGGGTRASSAPVLPCAMKYVAGNLYIGSGYSVFKVSQRTGRVTTLNPHLPGQPPFGDACGVAVDGAGNVLVADNAGVVAVAAKTGTFYGKKMVKGHVYLIVAGQAYTGAMDVQLDPSGNVVFAEAGQEGSTTNYEQDSQILVLAERAGTFYGKKMTKGRLYVIAGVLNGGSLPSPCDGPAAAAPATATKATQANLGFQIGTLRFDAAGNIILADGGSNSGGPCGGADDVSPYEVPSRVAVIPARTGSYYGQKMSVGYIYAIAGLGAKTGSGVPAVDSEFTVVYAVALDHAGNVLVAARNNGYPLGGIRVIAAKAGTFYGQKMIKGDIYALPGLDYANAVAVDNAGNVLAGNVDYSLVQMLAAKTGAYFGVKARAGRIYTIAGTGKVPA